MSKKFLSSGGSAAAAPHHGVKSSVLSVTIDKRPDEVCCSDIETVLRIKSPLIIGFDIISRPKSDEAILSFKNPEDAQRAKAVLKTCEFDISDGKKTFKRKPKVEVIRAEKTTFAYGPDLKDYDEVRAILAVHPSKTPSHMKCRQPTWLRECVMGFPGLFHISGGASVQIVQENVWISRLARCYVKSNTLNPGVIFRIAHPDNPEIVAKCVDMCTMKLSTYEYGWKSIGEVEIPETILKCHDLWEVSF